jgi:RNA polymerase sigma-70 factor (ECF subfamily)
MPHDQQTGDFVELWTAHSRRVYAFIMSLLPRWADADEILQETSRTLWEKFGEFKPGTNFTAWACQVAYLKVLEFRKRERRAPLPFSDAFLGTIDEELRSASDDLSPRYTMLLDCLQKLGEREQELVRQMYQPGATTVTVATAMGRSTAWVYKTLSRVHEKLFQCVERSMRGEARS